MAGYIGSTPVPLGIQEQQSFSASAGQTTFNTLGYSDGNTIKVTLNGVLLEGGGVDYTASNGSDIVLTAAASANDILTFETLNEFNLVNQNLTTPTFTDTASVTSTTTASVSVSGDTTATVTLKNNTEEDTDGGRESTLIFKGEQSGGEISTLAEIEASHDGTADDEKGDLIFRTNDGSDGASPTYAAKIDSSQNLLVGQTTASSGTVGTSFRSDGRNFFCADGNYSAQFNRKTSDGAIVNFAKDDSVVGSIKVADGDNLVISSTASNHAGLKFNNTAMSGYVNGASSDNTMDVGTSVVRFKDLYLGGGVYLGGTTASNKLEDYEEGTWTPTLPNGGTVGTIIKTAYTKIGNIVTAYCNVDLAPTNNGTIFNIGGLPFNGITGNHGAGNNSYAGGMDTRHWTAPLVDTGGKVYFHRRDGSTGTIPNSDFGGGNRQFIMQVTYILA